MTRSPLIVYDAMTCDEERALRAIGRGVLQCLQSKGVTDRHSWTIDVVDGVRFVRFGGKLERLRAPAAQVLTMTSEELLTAVRESFR